MTNLNPEVDEMIASTSDWRAERFATLRRLIHEADPEIVETVKWKRPTNPLGAPVFEHAGIVCTGALLKGRVRITFGLGALLPDPVGLYNASLEGKKMRGIDFYENDEIDEAAFKDLVRAAVGLNLSKAKPGKAQ
jgi:hypothetical protein